MNGYGELFYEDGRVYKGHFLHDQKHGQGIYVWTNGKQYDGGWREGKQHGIGKFTSVK